MIAVGPTRIEDDSEETIVSLVERLAQSGSEEQGVYRESEIDAVYNIVDLKFRELTPRDPSALKAAAQNLELVRKAHDLVHEGQTVQAAQVLQEWLRLRAVPGSGESIR